MQTANPQLAPSLLTEFQWNPEALKLCRFGPYFAGRIGVFAMSLPLALIS